MTKNHKDENFPVGSFLVKKELRPIVLEYYTLARTADDIADSAVFDTEEKLKKLDELEFYTKWREKFDALGLSYCLITDLLVAFRRDVKGFEYQSWEQLIDYCKYSAVPVGRFMLAIHNESLSTYQSAAVVCTALQIINHIQDMKEDIIKLNRVYIPSDLMREYGVSIDDLKADKISFALRNLVNKILDDITEMLKDGSQCVRLIGSFSLRCEVSTTIALAKILVAKLKKRDMLAHKIKLTKFEWFYGILSGIVKGIFR